METHNKLHKLSKNDIIVRPTIKNYKFAVQIVDNRNAVYKKKVTTGNYKHTSKTINKALEDTVDYVYDKLCNV